MLSFGNSDLSGIITVTVILQKTNDGIFMDIQLYCNELRMLKKALHSPLHRYIIAIIDNKNTYLDFYEWIKNNSPLPVHEINITGNRYREIIEPLKLVGNEIALIPDFDWLFIKGNDEIATAINLKRDFLAARNIKIICCMQPANLHKFPRFMTDFWSFRSLELDFTDYWSLSFSNLPTP